MLGLETVNEVVIRDTYLILGVIVWCYKDNKKFEKELKERDD